MAKRPITNDTPDPGGQPTKFRPEMCEQSRKLCLLGYTDKQLADFFGVIEVTINNWKVAHPEFAAALRAGKDVADAEVAASLYHRANGYSHPAVKIVVAGGAVQEVPYTEHFPPDTAAARLWLINRQPKAWRDKVENQITGPNGGPIQTVGLNTADPIEAARVYQELITGSGG